MKPPAFEYHAPGSLEEALAALASLGDEATVLAGGQSLVPMLALRIALPAHVVDVNGVRELGRIDGTGDGLALGALVRQQQALRSAAVAESCPLLAEALPLIGHRETRSRGTVGGSVAHADPTAEIPTVAVTLGAEVVLQSSRGTRTAAAEGFFTGPFMTAREPDELLTGLRFGAWPDGGGWSYQRIARRRHDIALVGVAALLRLDGAGAVAEVAIGLAGAAPTPVRARSAEALLAGQSPTAEAFATAAEEAVAGLEPGSDVLASGAYRKHVAKVLVRRALATAAARAQAAGA